MTFRTDSRAGRPGTPPRAAFLLVVFLLAFVSAAGFVAADCGDDCCHGASREDLCAAFCCGGLAATVQAGYRLPEPANFAGFALPAPDLPMDVAPEPPFRPPANA